jgi:hypothetical protein
VSSALFVAGKDKTQVRIVERIKNIYQSPTGDAKNYLHPFGNEGIHQHLASGSGLGPTLNFFTRFGLLGQFFLLGEILGWMILN